jgi:cyclophilin family peptidyl-prolyl cis-trans isomerase
MDILVEPFRHTQGTPQESPKTGNDGSSGSSNTDERHRLVIELASEVFPKAVQNFIGLLKADTHGYKSTTLHRVERSVGLMGGNVWKDTGKCLEEFRMSSSAQSMNQTEQLVLSHVPGVISMLCQRVDEIDSRFIFCSQHAPHLDGRALAIGRVDADSLQKLQNWESSLVTRNGRPTTVNLRIVECGVLEENVEEEQIAS